MKMQVAFLPDGKFALVLSRVNSAEVTQEVMNSFGEGIRKQTGAASVLVFEDDVELEGFISYGPDEAPAAMPDWTARVDGPLDWTRALMRSVQSED